MYVATSVISFPQRFFTIFLLSDGLDVLEPHVVWTLTFDSCFVCCLPSLGTDYKSSCVMFIIYTAIFVTWFVIFQVYSDTALRKINILFFTGKSPTNF